MAQTAKKASTAIPRAGRTETLSSTKKNTAAAAINGIMISVTIAFVHELPPASMFIYLIYVVFLV